jgi:hypothetical protein
VRVGLSLVPLVAPALAGCLIVPTPDHGILYGHGEITEDQSGDLVPGKTTRADVLLRFGEPSAISADESVLVYVWQMIQGYIAVVSYGGGAAGPLTDVHAVVLVFDRGGWLLHVERDDGNFSSPEEMIEEHLGAQPLEHLVGEPATTFVLRPEASPRVPGDAPLSASAPVRVHVAPIDRRGAARRRLGDRTALGFQTHQLYLHDGTTNVLLRELLEDTLTAAGHEVVPLDRADVVLSANRARLEVSTPGGLVDWDVLARCEVALTLVADGRRTLRRRYEAEALTETILGPDREDCEETIEACLAQLVGQLAADEELARFLGGD